jgi:predicted nucleic acid-binding protein
MLAEADRELYVIEPRGSYARRSPLVIDCSVVAAMLFDEPHRDEAQRMLAGHELYAPHLLDHEMISVANRKAREGRLDDARIAVMDYAAMVIARCQVDVHAQWALALRYELTGYDAAYLQLALDLQAPLATFDQRLGAAAKRALA